MNDIDFDEIDRAVSSASSRGGSTPTPATETRNDEMPQPTSTSSAVPAARRSSGRFMDVVHPSSDMRSSASRSAPRRDEPETPASEPSEAPTASKHQDWPDPLDFHGFTDTPAEPEAPVPEPTDTPAQPGDSPFLSDAKVEKRPLGAFSTETPSEATDESPSTDEVPTPEVSPEAEQTKEPVSAEEPKTEEKEPDTQSQEAPAATESAETPAVEATKPVDEPTGPTSITQQYKEQPSTTDQPSGAIYDTESYHKPLAYPAKKKSSALLIVWIFALLVVGGGAGAAVYFFVLPML